MNYATNFVNLARFQSFYSEIPKIFQKVLDRGPVLLYTGVRASPRTIWANMIAAGDSRRRASLYMSPIFFNPVGQ